MCACACGGGLEGLVQCCSSYVFMVSVANAYAAFFFYFLKAALESFFLLFFVRLATEAICFNELELEMNLPDHFRPYLFQSLHKTLLANKERPPCNE